MKKRQKKKRILKILTIVKNAAIFAGILCVILICIREITAYPGRREETDLAGHDTDTVETIPIETRTTEETAAETASEAETERETEHSEKTSKEKEEEIYAKKFLYPDKILNMLDKNIETLDFVYNYPEKQGRIYANHLKEEIEIGEIPLLIQWDERWGYGAYGDGILATNGCGPTCMAMVIAGLTGNTMITPYKVAKYSEDHGYLTADGSTMWSFIVDGGLAFEVQGQAISLNEETVMDALQQGFPIICSVRAGDFTDGGHFIVLIDCIDGKIKVNDPYSYANSEKLWEFERLQPQIKNLWKMQAIDIDE